MSTASAGRHDWKDKGTADGRSYELVGVENGQPIYYITCNAAAAALTGAETLQALPYSLDGEGLTVGLWSSGMVLATHNEFIDGAISRVTLMDSDILGRLLILLRLLLKLGAFFGSIISHLLCPT